MIRLAVFTLAGLLVTLVVSSVVSVSADALEWLVEGKSLSANETVEAYALGSSTFTSAFAGGYKIEILCDATTAPVVLIPKVTAESTGLSYKECRLVEPESCHLSSTLQTEPLTLDLTEASGKPLILLKPKSGNNFFTIVLEDCVLEGEYSLSGKTACEVGEPRVLEEYKNCVFEPGVDQELKFGGRDVTFESTYTFVLDGANRFKDWGVE